MSEKVVARKLTRSGAVKEVNNRLLSVGSKGRSSGNQRLHYKAKQGFLHWKVVEL